MERCEFPECNATDQEMNDILKNAKVIAVAGLSGNPSKTSYRVTSYLKDMGYKIIPVNPNYEEILDEKAYPDVKSIPEKVDIVNIFRKPEDVPPVVDSAIEAGVGAIWMQLGIVHNESANKARAAGIPVVMNKCIMVEHQQII